MAVAPSGSWTWNRTAEASGRWARRGYNLWFTGAELAAEEWL